MAAGGQPLFWYTIPETDRDQLNFLVHLLSIFGEYGKAALNILESSCGRVGAEALNPMLNAPTKGAKAEAILVLDDFHLVVDVGEIVELIKIGDRFCAWTAGNIPGLGYGLEKFFGEKANFLLGVVYILIVLFLPYGIIGTWYMKSFQIRSGWQRLLGFMRKKKV